ncbi:hypothetical protein PoB_007047000 [Plakobranchus ocellatus]|uniref:Uncharacterized protein n=1 Tax=Plakobranchus ocellatus TaxID=259542 RepID=A0AAV4DIZ1_9GAST|nr:hypothetical protein PoB_007047000 [Plakobranchus ocellatus]
MTHQEPPSRSVPPLSPLHELNSLGIWTRPGQFYGRWLKMPEPQQDHCNQVFVCYVKQCVSGQIRALILFILQLHTLLRDFACNGRQYSPWAARSNKILHSLKEMSSSDFFDPKEMVNKLKNQDPYDADEKAAYYEPGYC